MALLDTLGVNGSSLIQDWGGQVQPALVFSFVFLFLLEACLWVSNVMNKRSPPGPFAWPVVGNAMQLGHLPHLTFCKLAQKYGNIFQIRLGRHNIIVLNGESTIRQALIRQSTEFAGRPKFASFQIISGGKSMAFGGYNSLWKSQRRIAHSVLRAFSTANADTKKLFEQHVCAEAVDLIKVFMQLGEHGQYFNPSHEFSVAAANVICALCFGKRYSHDDVEFRALLSRNDKFGKTVSAGSLVDTLPWLQAFPNPIRNIYESFKELNTEFFNFVKNKVTQHRQTYNPDVTRDMSDAIITLVEHGTGKSHGLTRDYVEATVTDILGAGQDTSSTALTWIILLLIKYPNIQNRLQEEIDKVIGRERLPTLEDCKRLPHLEAFIYETLRFTSFVPVTIPHATTANVVIDGFEIPKDTVVFINQWSVNHDEKKWKDPGTFNPSRFLDDNGSIDKDLVNSVMIFSLGKRRCIGDQLSRLQIFLFTSILLQQCTFQANPSEKLTMDCISGLAVKPQPFTVVVKKRSEMVNGITKYPLYEPFIMPNNDMNK
ncbi:cytochrome P450 1B1-like [Protopterus annectens]|uniref:cytochrome P450 1B1-like n=1 Tax=Protopterus annectens TaxID=7888 RepID=UPI001CF9E9A7|nr:cytochrome P450 1B1-like [Protopterus annectens]